MSQYVKQTPGDVWTTSGTPSLAPNASTETTLALIKAKTDNLDVALSTRTKPGDTQAVSAASLPLPSGAAQDGADGATPPVIPGSGIRGWLRSIYDKLAGSIAVTGTFWQATQPVSGTFFQATQPVSGAFFQATQPVSAATLPLPTNAATDASITNGNLRVGGTTAVSAASLPLPSGAATDASITNGNLRGTVTANAGTNLNTSALALEAGGNLASVLTQLTAILANQTNGSQVAIDTTLADMLQSIQQQLAQHASLLSSQLRVLAANAGMFIPTPDLPAFLGGA